MGILLQRLNDSIPDTEFTAIREWSNGTGVMGVYRERTSDAEAGGRTEIHHSLAIWLVGEQDLFLERIDTPLASLLRDAGIVARFAGATIISEEGASKA